MEIIAINNRYNKIIFLDDNNKLFVIGKEDPIWDGVEYVCPICGQAVSVRDLFMTSDGVMCKDCVEGGDYTQCDYCGNYSRNTTMDSEGRGICSDCLNTYYNQCRSCGEWFRNSETSLTHVTGFGNVCDSCLEDFHCDGSVVTCENCGEELLLEDAYEEDGDYYCESCHDDIYEENEEDDDPDGYIDRYHQSRDPRFKSLNSDCALPKKANLYLGMEIELANVGTYNGDLARTIYNEYDWKCEHDCSINDGFEIISDAMTLPYWKRNVDIAGLINEAVSEGFAPDYTVGIHVHINRGPLDDDACAEIGWFINEHFDDMIKFGRRSPYHTDYCGRCGDVVDKDDVTYYLNGHSYCVNFENKSNIEIRCFKSSDDVDHIWAILEFCFCLANVAKGGAVDITWADLRKFAEERDDCGHFLKELNAGFKNEVTDRYEYCESDEILALCQAI